MNDLLALLLVLALALGCLFRPAYLVPPSEDDEEEEEEKDDDEEEEEEEEGEDDDKKISAKEHKAALAAARNKAGRRFRKMEKRHKADLEKLREEMGLDDEEEEEEEEGRKGKKKKAAGRPSALANRARKEKARADAAEAKLAQREAEGDLRAAAKKHKGDADLLVGVLGSKIRTDDDGEPFVVLTVDGDRVNLSIEEAVEETLQRHPRLLLSKKTPGGGGTRKPGGGRGGKAGGKGTKKKPETFEDAEAALLKRLGESS